MSDDSAASALWRLIDGFKVSQAIHAAASLGVADRIAEGARASDEIADAAGADRGAVYRLLRALAAHGVLREDEGRRFSLTAMGECLRSDADPSLSPYAVLIGQPYYWQAWGQLLHAVQTGENAFRSVHGATTWTYRQQHPDQNAVFNAAMTANSRRVDRAIVDACDFSRFPRVADIGGGEGSLLAAVLAACPATRGVLVDRPHVVASAAPLLAAASVAERCEVVGGDFFEDIPGGCDAYILKFVLHDWDDTNAGRILRGCRRAMPQEGRLFIVERIIGPPDHDPAAARSDLNMLVVQGGRERTRPEFDALLAGAALRVADVLTTDAGLPVLVVVPA